MPRTDVARTLIATPASDARLARQYRARGAKARQDGLERTPPGDPRSMLAGWWYEGYDSGNAGPACAL